MGLSIHYNGTLANIARLPELVSEVRALCEELGWTFHGFDEDDDVHGICFWPGGCEPLFFTVLPSGPALVSPVRVQYEIDPVTDISVKTQYAGVEAHMAVIKLLHYLADKYCSAFDCLDEGKYWETGDEALLRAHFDRYNRLLDAVAGALEGLEAREGESPDALAGRVAEALQHLGGSVQVIRVDPEGGPENS